MTTTNYDEIRVGNKIRVEAMRFTERELENKYPADEHAMHHQRIFAERERELTLAYNNEQLSNIPLSGVQVTDSNKDMMVIRYSLRDDVSRDKAEAVIERWKAAVTDIDVDQKQTSFDEILEEALVIHEVPMIEAAQSDNLKRFPSECLDSIDSILDKVETPPVPSHDSVSADMFALPDISGEALVIRLEQLDTTHVEMAKAIDVHHQTAAKWTRDGVPAEYKKAAWNFLT